LRSQGLPFYNREGLPLIKLFCGPAIACGAIIALAFVTSGARVFGAEGDGYLGAQRGRCLGEG
jgi:formate-dependent nitrite reductase membrane component NrfD